MKVQWGSEVSLHYFLNSVNATPLPLCSRKELRYLLEEAGWSPGSELTGFVEEKNPLLP